MKLDSKEFKRFRELEKLIKAKKATPAEQGEYDDLLAKKNEKGSNAIQWWKNYPALLKDVINVAFNWIPGTPVVVSDSNNTSVELALGLIAKATLRPSIGKSTSDSDAFNAQIRQLWLDMHRKYRGIGTYEKSDLGIALLAINGLFESIAKFERIYGTINTYHIGNRTVPYGLKEALGISNDLEENLANFRYTLNLFIAKVKQLCLPKGLSVLESDIVALTNIFKDSANRRAFLFMFDQDLFAIYNPTIFSSGGAVTYARYSDYMTGVTPFGKPAFTLSDIKTVLDAQVNQLLNDDDIARICSDLLAAYGPENAMTMVEVPEDYRVEPVEDYERKVQFHNLTIVPAPQSIYSANPSISSATDANTVAANFPICVYQNNNVIYNQLGVSDDTANYASTADGYFPTRTSSGAYNSIRGKISEVIFDTFVEDPGEVEIMCGSRYTVLCQTEASVTTNVYRAEIDVMGTKVCSALDIYTFSTAAKFALRRFIGSVVAASPFKNSYDQYAALMQMDWHPCFYIQDTNSLTLFGDVDNFAILNRDTLGRLHEVALLSGYKIPMISKE